MGTVDVLLSPPDLPPQAPPHVRPLEDSTETPLHRQGGSVDSHRELCRKNMAQFFQVAWEILSTLTSPPEWGRALGCGGSED